MANGLTGRKPGDVFTNGTSLLHFKSIAFFPNGGKVSPDKLRETVDGLSNVYFENVMSSRSGAYSISTFEDEFGNEKNSIRFLTQVNPNTRCNFIPNAVFGDFKYGGKAAVKTRCNMSPQDLLTSYENLTVEQVVEQLGAKLGNNHLVKVAEKIAAGDSFPYVIKPNDLSFLAFRDYYCEILHPLALQRGLFTGNAEIAGNKFLGCDFSDCLISYSVSKNTGLADSVLSNGDKKLLVSSKAANNGGASASVKNLLAYAPEGEVGQLLQLIADSGQHDAPLVLGKKFGVIDESEYSYIKSTRYAEAIPFVDKTLPTPNLENLAEGRKTADYSSVNMYYHLLAAVAHKSADHVNEKTEFSNVCKSALNNAGMIQMYTHAKETKTEWVLEGFDTLYPTDAVKDVKISATKNYSSTAIKGNFTFKIVK